MKIWLLTVGEYSDYRVVAVFDEEHKAEAEKYAEWIGGDVEESLVLNDYKCEEPLKDRQFYVFQMHRDGSTTEIRTRSSLRSNGMYWHSHYWLDSKKRYHWKPAWHWCLHIEMYAKSKEHAVKVANEIRVQILAGAKPDEGVLP